MLKLHNAINKGCVRSCHDCSDGGMAVALAEMAFAGGFGMNIHLDTSGMPKGQAMLPNDTILFSESNSRFIVEVSDESGFKKTMTGVPIWKVGFVSKEKRFKVHDFDNRPVIDTDIEELKAAWQETFKDI